MFTFENFLYCLLILVLLVLAYGWIKSREVSDTKVSDSIASLIEMVTNLIKSLIGLFTAKK